MLTCLVGVLKAVEMCVTGKSTKADDALTSGLIDATIDARSASAAGAIAFAREAAKSTDVGPGRDRREKLEFGEGDSYIVGPPMQGKVRRGEIAP